MAIRRQRLRHRILAMGSTSPELAAVTPATPMVMPLARVVVGAAQSGAGSYGGYVTLGSAEYLPLFTTDGAVVPATGPGTWGQLAAAGRA